MELEIFNEAEYHTLVGALDDLLRRLDMRAGESTLEARGDSQLVIEQVLGRWKAKDERMRALRDEVRHRLNRFKRHRLAQQPREDSLRVLGTEEDRRPRRSIVCRPWS